MATLLEALKGARKVAEMAYPEGKVIHWLLPNGYVIEAIER
jgi:hypothetical protein